MIDSATHHGLADRIGCGSSVSLGIVGQAEAGGCPSGGGACFAGVSDILSILALTKHVLSVYVCLNECVSDR